jgi:hypothetical protein
VKREFLVDNHQLANEPDGDFYERVARCLDGRLAAEEFARLQDELAGDPRKCALFSDICVQATLLAESGIGAAADAQQSADAPSPQEKRLPDGPRAARRRRSPVLGFLHNFNRRMRRTYGEVRYNTVLAVICGLLFSAAVAGTGAIIQAILMSRERPADQSIADNRPLAPAEGKGEGSPVARLGRTVDCAWAGETVAAKVGDKLAAGRKLVLQSGLAEIIFENGAQALLQGPATLEVRSRSSALLSRGKIAVTVENPAARGFEIDAPGMKYTDFGTEFGVLVAQSGAQEVHVFRGTVQAATNADRQKGRQGERENLQSPPLPVAPSPPPLLLSANESIRVEKPQDNAPPVIVRQAAKPDQFVRTEQMPQVIAKLDRWKQYRDELCKRPDLVAYYDFQPDEADRTVLRNRAAAGAEFDGKLLPGTEWAEGRFSGKQSLHFDQSGSGVRVSIPVDCKQLTLVAWFRLDRVVPTGLQSILVSDTWNSRAGSLHCQRYDTRGFGYGVSLVNRGEQVVLPRVDVPVGTWVMGAITYDADHAVGSCYFNGRLMGQAPLKAKIPARIDGATIGGFQSADNQKVPDRTLHGRIDELMIFSSALSAEEIRLIFERLRSGQ